MVEPAGSVLVVGGHDPTLGAGVAADTLAVTLAGSRVHAAVAVMTVQGPGRPVECSPVDPDLLGRQLDAVGADAAVVKTGALGTRSQVMSVVRFLDAHPRITLVVDPVMGATAGGALLDEGGRRAVMEELMCRATLVTPNLDEAASLALMDRCDDRDGMLVAAQRILSMGAMWALVKGGHLPGAPVDLLAGKDVEPEWLEGTRVEVSRTHGTGCALASAIAGYIAGGRDVREACNAARELLARALADASGPDPAPDLLGLVRRQVDLGG